jgi:hypothetical protein
VVLEHDVDLQGLQQWFENTMWIYKVNSSDLRTQDELTRFNTVIEEHNVDLQG